jgi:hypothetical protein
MTYQTFNWLKTCRLETRRKEAVARKKERSKLSPTEQMKRLDWRLGKGVGAQKERARLRKLMEN